ncbi:MAG: hypothetical protein HQM12_07850 [SAR324 cluster bacterium]|nr:hypothetical protein [SAR324 cluster bacterium]MBF0351476.1 hypothetical protein [SAR324 cluster bacterium]
MKVILKRTIGVMALLWVMAGYGWASDDLCKNAPVPCFVVFGEVENTIYDPEALKRGELQFSVNIKIGNSSLSFVLNKVIPMGANLLMGITLQKDGTLLVIDTVPYPGKNPFVTNIDLPLKCEGVQKCFHTEGFILENDPVKAETVIDIGGKQKSMAGPTVGQKGERVLMKVTINGGEMEVDYSATQKYVNGLYQFRTKTQADLRAWQAIGKAIEKELEKLP